MTLSGRKVLITGASRGLGASFVGNIIARQASTVYAAARNPALLPPVLGSGPGGSRAPRRHGSAGGYRCGGRANGHRPAVSNAGVTCHGPVLGGDDEATFREVLEVNFFGHCGWCEASARCFGLPGQA